MPFLFVLFLLLWFPKFSWALESGLYQVQRAWLNSASCSEPGKPVSYASRYLRVQASGDTEPVYTVSTCDGEWIEDLNCGGGNRSTMLREQGPEGMAGYYFFAQKQNRAGKRPQCELTALRRRVKPGKGGMLHYERSDWFSILDDYQYECVDETAKLFFQAQSLACSTHIVIEALRVAD